MPHFETGADHTAEFSRTCQLGGICIPSTACTVTGSSQAEDTCACPGKRTEGSIGKIIITGRQVRAACLYICAGSSAVRVDKTPCSHGSFNAQTARQLVHYGILGLD